MRISSPPEVRGAERVLTVSYLEIPISGFVITDQAKTICTYGDRRVRSRGTGFIDSGYRGTRTVGVQTVSYLEILIGVVGVANES